LNIYNVKPDDLKSRVEKNVAFHIWSVVSAVKQLDKDFHSGHYEQCGKHAVPAAYILFK